MREIFFSVIIPTLNEEKFLPRILKDLNNQFYKGFEVIIVDGHSEDKTIEIANHYKKLFSKLNIVSTNKRNLCHQRNLGANHAEGTYLVFLDADVQVSNRYLYEIHRAIKSTSAVFLTTYQLPDVKNKLDVMMVKIANYTLDFLALINYQMAPGYNFIVKKTIFDKARGFDEKVTIGEDHDLSIRILKKTKNKLKIIKKTLLKWSFRRIQKEGRAPIIIRYALATLHTITLGKVMDKNLGYSMGGHHFNHIGKGKMKNFNEELKKTILKILSG